MPDIERSLLLELATGRSLGRYFLDDEMLDGPAAQEVPTTNLLAGPQLAHIRERFEQDHPDIVALVDPLREEASKLLALDPPSVRDKSRNVTGGAKNDYVTLAKYWWLVTKADGTVAYENRDGSVNPECYEEHFDYLRFTEMAAASVNLALAAYLAKEPAFGAKAASIIDRWFLDPETGQTPHFKYAQIVPDRDVLRGVGIIEARSLIYVCEAAAMLFVDGHLTPAQMEALRTWFRTLLDWMLESPQGKQAGEASNNISLWYHAQCRFYALFCGNETVAEASLLRIRRLALEQIAPDGTMPREMARNRPHDYAAFSLIALSGLDAGTRRAGVAPPDSEDAAGRVLTSARDWLMATAEAADIRASLAELGRKTPAAAEIDDRLNLVIAARLLDRQEHQFRRSRVEIEALRQQTETMRRALEESEARRRESKKRSRVETEALRQQTDAMRRTLEESEARRLEIDSRRKDISTQNTALRHKRDSLVRQNQRLRKSDAAQRRSRTRLKRLLAVLALPYVIVTLPFSGPFLLWFLYRRRSRALQKAETARSEATPPTAGAAAAMAKESAPGELHPPRRLQREPQKAEARPSGSGAIATIKKERDPAGFYPPSPVDAEPDTFVLYRIVGNDLVPRHAKGQAFSNVSFILENEPDLEDCRKLWLLNRIQDEQEKTRIVRLLDSAGQEYIDIPFDWDEYRRIGWDFAALPDLEFFASKAFSELNPEQKMRALTAVYRLKNLYVMHNNGARNAALEHGVGQAKWVLPWDGNCFVTRRAWSDIRQAVTAKPLFRYFITPMQRITDNSRLLNEDFTPEPLEEPQLIFRRDAVELFNTEFPYGRRPKVELFWRLGVPGSWDRWRDDPWEQTRRKHAPEAGYVGTAGWVARLASGQHGLEKQGDRASFKRRGLVRSEAILAAIDHVDATAARSEAPAFYHESALARLAEPRDSDARSAELRKTLVQAAEKALQAGVFSVVDKTTAPPSGDMQDYWHPAPYWWPDPSKSDGKPYIRRDGERVPGTRLYEPASDQFDRTRLQRMFDNTTILALAARVTGRPDFAEHGARLVRIWFLDPERRMNPHLRYAQVRRGRNNDEGAATGIIEFKDLYFLLDAVRLLEGFGAFMPADSAALRGWLAEYQDWLEASRQGHDECASTNNHGTYFDLQAAAIASYLGDQDRLRTIYFRAQSRLVQQIGGDGQQPEEMKRTLTQHYVHFNLQGLLNIFRIMQAEGRPVPLQDREPGRRLAAALEWVLRQDQYAWPFQQIEPFDHGRTLALTTSAASLGILPEGLAARLRDHGEAKPVFDPHDAVHPFWNIADPALSSRDVPPKASSASA